ncbi:acyltransferase family protein [Salinicoccus sp. YB14-2]|uniref:acyltransferase family protein n=1 Tax=Salinicoccus sp. YB14-2 TaxID=1572701 RepID=UPI000691CB3D|nr:acyltransferase family protein [Salinicoccus sp. YB14-2]
MSNHSNQLKLQSSRYMPGLDGLRAIAVIAIILYHLNPRWLPGGFLGVDTFFVISGYLITSLLLREYHNTQMIDLKNFWIRRFRRLIPAVFFMTSVVITYVLIFESGIIRTVKEDGIAAFLYMSNWWYIIEDVSYFEASEPKPLMHLWSLAIEEQFYIIWPAALLILLLKIKNYKHIMLIIFMMTLISLIWMMVLTVPFEDNSRVYFGTDTRLQTLLLGVLLAYIWPPFKLKKDIGQKIKVWIDGVGVGALLVLVIIFITVDDSSHWIYYGGLYLITLVTLLLIASSVHPSTVLPKILGNPLFLWVGTRSYSLYLWHYPIIILINVNFVQGQIPYYIILLQILLTIIFAEISYKWIETPFRRHGFKAVWPSSQKRLRLITTVTVAAVSLTVMTGLFDDLHEDVNKNRQTHYLFEQNTQKESEEPSDETLNLQEITPLFIGDSIMVNVGEELESRIPNAVIDGEVGRQVRDTVELVEHKYSDYGNPDDIIVIQLGTNGTFTEDELNALIDIFGDAEIYFVNTRVPRSWETSVNESLEEAGNNHGNVTIIDWYSYSEDKTEYFSADGVHLLPEGIESMADLIIDAIKQN